MSYATSNNKQLFAALAYTAPNVVSEYQKNTLVQTGTSLPSHAFHTTQAHNTLSKIVLTFELPLNAVHLAPTDT